MDAGTRSYLACFKVPSVSPFHLAYTTLCCLYSLLVHSTAFLSALQLTPMIMDVQSPAAIAEALLGALEQYGQGDYIGESINQLEHSLQAAHQARTAGMCLRSPRGEARDS